MVRLGPIALMVILSSAAAATACCFFKCCFKSAEGPPGASVGSAPFSGAVAFLRITQVAGQAPDSTNNIPSDVDSTVDLQVVVQSNFDPSMSDPELIVTDEGPRGIAPEVKKTKKYKPVKIVQQPLEKVPMPSPPSPIPPIGSVWLTFYKVPSSDLKRGENYSVVATAGSVTSNRVTFHTAK